MRKSARQFELEFKAATGGEYQLLTPYQVSTEKVKVKHLICGHIWEATPPNLLKGSRCPCCMRVKTTEQFKWEVHALAGETYEVVSEYQSAHVKVWMKHHVCGHQWKTSPTNFLHGNFCPHCYPRRNLIKTTEDFKSDVFRKTGEDYQVLGVYQGNRAPILIQHRACGHTWHVRPANFLSGTRCPNCARVGRRPKSCL